MWQRLRTSTREKNSGDLVEFEEDFLLGIHE